MIRAARPGDIDRLKEITCEVFGPSAVDYYIEEHFGTVLGRDWKWRKVRHIDADVAENPGGVFVFEREADGRTEIAGYVTIVIDREGGIGRIPNLAVCSRAQNQGIGRKLLNHAFEYLRKEKVPYAKIETLVGNEAGEHLYPAMGFAEVARQIHYVKKL